MYYSQAEGVEFVANIQSPTLMIVAKDDGICLRRCTCNVRYLCV